MVWKIFCQNVSHYNGFRSFSKVWWNHKSDICSRRQLWIAGCIDLIHSEALFIHSVTFKWLQYIWCNLSRLHDHALKTSFKQTCEAAQEFINTLFVHVSSGMWCELVVKHERKWWTWILPPADGVGRRMRNGFWSVLLAWVKRICDARCARHVRYKHHTEGALMRSWILTWPSCRAALTDGHANTTISHGGMRDSRRTQYHGSGCVYNWQP